MGPGGQMGAMMGPQDMQSMRSEMAALRDEIRQLREDLAKAR